MILIISFDLFGIPLKLSRIFLKICKWILLKMCLNCKVVCSIASCLLILSLKRHFYLWFHGIGTYVAIMHAYCCNFFLLFRQLPLSFLLSTLLTPWSVPLFLWSSPILHLPLAPRYFPGSLNYLWHYSL